MTSRSVRRWVAQGVLAACAAGAVVGWSVPELLRTAAAGAARTAAAAPGAGMGEAQQVELQQAFAHMEGRLTHRLRTRKTQRSARRPSRAQSRLPRVGARV